MAMYGGVDNLFLNNMLSEMGGMGMAPTTSMPQLGGGTSVPDPSGGMGISKGDMFTGLAQVLPGLMKAPDPMKPTAMGPGPSVGDAKLAQSLMAQPMPKAAAPLPSLAQFLMPRR